MKVFRYKVPKFGRKFRVGAFTVKAWKTAAEGLIVQHPHLKDAGWFHLVHQPSGYIIKSRDNRDDLFTMAEQFEKLPVLWAVPEPWNLYKQLLTLSDAELDHFTAALQGGRAFKNRQAFRNAMSKLSNREAFMKWRETELR